MKNGSLVAGVLVGTLLVGAAGVGVSRGVFGSGAHELRLSFPTGDGLVPGSDVFEAGARIGSISAIEPQAVADPGFSGPGRSGDRALVTVEIDSSHWPLHDGLKAGIRPKSLLGEKYVDLHDNGTAPYDPSKVLVAPADSVPVELDQFINALDPNTRASARVLLNDLGAGIAGRGVDLNQAIATGRYNLAHLAVTGKTLNNRDPDLDRIIVGLDGVLAKLTQNDQLTQLSQLIDNGQKTLNAIEAEQSSFKRSFIDAQAMLTDLNGAIDPAIGSLRNTIDSAPHLLTFLANESTVVAQLASGITSGNVLSIFQQAITAGPTTLGGATEFANGHVYPITRVCLENPFATSGLPASCAGNGFPQTKPQPVPTQASASGGNGATTLYTLVGFLGA